MADLASIIGSIGQSGVGAGFEQAGFDLAGGRSGMGAQAYAKGAEQGLDLVKKRLEARQLRDKSMARDSMLQKWRAANPSAPAEQLEFMDAIIRGEMGSNFNSAMSGMKDQQYMDLQRRAAELTDPDARNAVLAAMSGEPLERTSISGGTAYDPYASPGEQTMLITPAAAADDVRQAMVAGSQVARNEASARNYDRSNDGSSPMQKRASTMEEDAKLIEREIGREMTPAERSKYLQTGRFQLSKSETEAQRRTNIGHNVVDGTDEGRPGLGAGVSARDDVADAMTPAQAPSDVDMGTGVSRGDAVNPAALDKAMQAFRAGKSRAGIAAKLRASGFTAEADAFETMTL